MTCGRRGERPVRSFVATKTGPIAVVLPNGCHLGRFATRKGNRSYTHWNAMALLENTQSVIDHALKLLLFHCTTGFVSLAMDIVTPIAVGGFELDRFEINSGFCFKLGLVVTTMGIGER